MSNLISAVMNYINNKNIYMHVYIHIYLFFKLIVFMNVVLKVIATFSFFFLSFFYFLFYCKVNNFNYILIHFILLMIMQLKKFKCIVN